MKGLQWKIGLALVVIFVAGVGVGWVAGRQAIFARQKAMARPGAWDGMVLRRMEERLKLTEEQKATIKPILEETAQKLQAQRRRAMFEQGQSLRGFHEQVEPHLTQAQKEELARSRQQAREKLRDEFPLLPPKPGGGGMGTGRPGPPQNP